MFTCSCQVCPHFLIVVANSPFFDSVTLELPVLGSGRGDAPVSTKLHISAPGAPSQPYVRSLRVHGRNMDGPIITHADIVRGGHIKFDMSAEPQPWASGTLTAGTDQSGELHSGVQAHYHIDL